jgi:hypothetical protein
MFVVDGSDVTILAVYDELRIHFGDLLRDQTILLRTFPVAVEGGFAASPGVDRIKEKPPLHEGGGFVEELGFKTD